MIPGMVSDSMTFGLFLSREFGMQLNLLAYQEEGELNFFIVGQLQYRWGVLGIGTVV
jgi:hypothetical protein